MKDVEILAPVGNFEMLMTAIQVKADAVYFGLENFNARAKADNFNSENIREIIELCHLYGVKAYITVNTLISNDEMSKVVQMIEKAYMAKADAFIIQDLGLARILKQTYPNIELHASTQMGVCNVKGAKVLEKLGFSRVVVARETTLEDIKQINEQTNLEIEAFVQGALCVCYSGSCYLSSTLKNKSGNRGECLQLCRLPYKLVQNGKIKKTGYLLSTRDISLISKLDDLIKAGVCSLKIEGRLRRPAYLAQSVISVRNVLERGTNLKDEDYALKKVFSRGEYNKGIYLNSKTDGGLINSEVNNHLGVVIGKVLKTEPFKDIYKITISSKHNIEQGDGLKFISDKKQSSMGVGSVKKLVANQYEIFGKVKPEICSNVFLTVDSKNEQKLIDIKRKLQINAKIYAMAGKNLKIELSYNDISICYKGDILEKAQNQPVTKADFISSFSKISDTHFEINSIEVDTDNVFIAKSVINRARRESLKLLEEMIIEKFELKNNKNFIKIAQNNKENIQKNINYNYYIVENCKKLENLNKNNAKIIYAPQFYDFEDIDSVKRYVEINYCTKLYLYLPVVANYKDVKLIDEILNKFNKAEIGIAAGSIYGLIYANDGFDVIALMNNNIANDYSRDLLFELGCCDCVSSIETNLFNRINGSIKYIGNPSLMTLVMCPFIEHTGSSCKNCLYNNDSEFIMDDGTKLAIRRTKLVDCYFELYQKRKITIPDGNGYIVDLRD